MIRLSCLFLTALLLSVLPAFGQSPFEPLSASNAESIDELGFIPRPTRNQMLDMAWSPDGTRLALAVDTGVLVYDLLPTGTRRGLHIQQTWMRCVAFSPDGALIVSCDSDGIVWLWDAQTGERVATFSLGNEIVEDALFSPDGRLVAALGLNTEGVEIWGLASGAAITRANAYRINRIRVLGDETTWKHMAFRPGENTLTYATIYGKLRVWDADTGADINAREMNMGSDSYFNALSYSGDGSLLATLSNAGNVHILDANTMEDRLVLDMPDAEDVVYRVDFTPDGGLLAVAVRNSFGGKIYVFEPENGALLNALTGHPDSIWAMAFNPAGDLLASLAFNDGVRLWGIGQKLPVLPTATPTRAPTTTPTPTLTPTTAPTLQVGGTATVTTTGGDTLNMRNGAGRGYELVAKLSAGTVVMLLEGPIEADGLRWWRIRTPDGIEGWAVEQVDDEQTLTPA